MGHSYMIAVIFPGQINGLHFITIDLLLVIWR